jgi:hypothetical protein
MKTVLRITSLLLVASPLSAQTATPKVPIHQLSAPVTSTEVLGSLSAVRQLPNGNVLVNDQAGRRVLLMDSSLAVIGVVADSTSSTSSAYGPRPGGLIPYRGDSTLFVDPASLSMLVIDPAGKIARVMAAPRPNDVAFLTGGPFGNPGFDSKGRLIYRSFAGPTGGGPPRSANGAFVPPVFPDSAALVRFDLASRKLDTAGYLKVLKLNMTMSQDANGGIRMQSIINPLPVVDEWAMTSDGAIAIVRGRDYRVDFINADGTRTTGEKIPYEWQRLTDEDKIAFIDSTKSMLARQRAAGGAPGAGGAAGAGGGGVGGAGGPAGAAPTMILMRPRDGAAGSDGPPPGAGGANIVVGGPPPGGLQPPSLVSPSELPDYKPVFGPGAVRADADGRVWVRTIPTKPMAGGAIYEVIDRSGKLVDKVQVPAATTIAGFGPGGVVYLGMRDAKGVHVQRGRLTMKQ